MIMERNEGGGETSGMLNVNVVETDASVDQEVRSRPIVDMVEDLLFLGEAKLREMGFKEIYVSAISCLHRAAKSLLVTYRSFFTFVTEHQSLLFERDALHTKYEEVKSRVIAAEKRGDAVEKELEEMEVLLEARDAVSEKLKVKADEMAKMEDRIEKVGIAVTRLEVSVEFSSGRKWNAEAEIKACDAYLEGSGPSVPSWMDTVWSAMKRMEREHNQQQSIGELG